ncbi:plasmid stabilization protein [Pseudorhizobium endolithicum]|uniref:Plasmid stabilization protein n=1 Tax=Pseudorhizobium endolithicum TaxID=1191678 RepID=A0ABM8PJJ4_9HYPH|nr:plasmid stability protein [Pseudorhizobium endolithicum]CAD7033579.1 plasmid stabilization protein [Pseudorhizobium endolithicum]
MNAITIRNLSDEESRLLQTLALEHGTSVEAEAQRILREALVNGQKALKEPLAQQPPLKLGTALWELGQEFGGLDDLDFSRDQTPARGVSFE